MITALLLACVTEVPREPGVVVVVQEQQASWIRNFNPFAPTSSRWPTSCGVYEPLMVMNTATGEWVPWLATDYGWNEDGTELTFTIREGVKWSDGTPFEAHDVADTFTLMKQHPGLDVGGTWSGLRDVAWDGDEVVFSFDQPSVTRLGAIAHTPIVPDHVWGELENPVVFANEDPVATGPFTEVRLFRSQVFELGANPHYWQELGVEALRFPAVSSNEQANLALIRGELDWAGMFVPAVDRTYIERDPKHFDAWFPTTSGTTFLYANTTVEPFDDPRVRKALSLAIDRELLVEVAMYGYTTPSHPSGLSDGHASWRRDDLPDLVSRDLAEAGRLLDEAGLEMGPDGWRTNPDGSPLELEITSPAGWSDWVRAIQVIAASLRDAGLDVRVAGRDFSAWYERLSRGDFELSLGWSENGESPVALYRPLMDPAYIQPIGEASFRNWQRFGDARAGQLFEAYDRTPLREDQQVLVNELQDRFVETMPAIPLFPAPSWGESNHRYITGFPSKDDPYASLSPNDVPGVLLVMTSLDTRDTGLAQATP